MIVQLHRLIDLRHYLEPVLVQVDHVVDGDLPPVLLDKLPAIALGLELVDVDGDGADPEELDAVHGEVLLVLVEQPYDDVVIVASSLSELGVKHTNLALRGSIISQRY